jgi:plasmid rolling circle replication initiator protein Rep
MYLRRVLMGTLQAIFQDEDAAYYNPKRQRDWERVHNCQSEWIGYKAACCDSYTKRIAVPIGCNHRLCPLCAWHRAENGRKRIRKMFDRLTHPYLLTLTIPNQPTISKHDFTMFRQRVRAFIKQHSSWIQGGIYSLETTYNREEKTWHIHVHVLLDAAAALPNRNSYTEFHGQKMRHFTLLKKRLEFDWLQLWDKRWRERKRPNVEDMERVGTLFDRWFELAEANKVREFSHREAGRAVYRDIELPARERTRRTEWNRHNRRMVDVRPVTNRDGAAYEVLKYITKVSAFADVPEAVEQFLTAVKGTRLVQTFGSWYGLKLTDDANEMDWSKLACSCGVNDWHRCGVFFRHEVHMEPDGRWVVKRELEDFSSTGHRVTIPLET